MKKRRIRGVYLDKEKVQARAGVIGCSSLTDFEIRYIRHFNISDSKNTDAPLKAWHGRKMDKKFANNIAEILGLPDFIPLLIEQTQTPWKKLLEDERYLANFMRFRLLSDEGKQLIETSDFYQQSSQKRDEVRVNQRWFLELSGHESDCFFILLQSDTVSFQLAPIDADGFVHVIPAKSAVLRYPSEKSFSFRKEDGLGRRCCIAIRASFLPVSKKSVETGFYLSAHELNELALRLIHADNANIAIDQYFFELVK